MLCQGLSAQNPLAVPDTLSGTSFTLNILDTSKVFYTGISTNTYGINANYLGPTLILRKGDSVSVAFSNQLMDTTTIHWHGMHVSAMNDGGPHITIAPGTTWNPSFKVRDQAAMYWYHPHLHMMTNRHATLGAAGLVIVRDSAEEALLLPRRYGIDDFPLVVQSKAFDAGKQIVVDDASDSVMMVNGTLDPLLAVPAQVVRLRLLNASSERVYNFGLLGDLTFYQIGSDGGLLNAPVALTRLMLAPGERAEILVDFTGQQGQTHQLMSFAAELPNAIYGAAQPGMGAGQTIPGYSANSLNGSNFEVLTLQVVAPTGNPVTTVPSSLILNTPWNVANANAFRTLTFSPLNMGSTALLGPFLINGAGFDMGVINYTIPRDNIEEWTLTNQSPIAHPFHIHDVQFYVTQYNGAAPPAGMAGRKDVVLVPAGQTVKFITRFETFCDSAMPYMYHCHMLPHEDDGMMGQFVVTCPAVAGIAESGAGKDLELFPNPVQAGDRVMIVAGEQISEVTVSDLNGKALQILAGLSATTCSLPTAKLVAGIYLVAIKGTSGNTAYRKLTILN